MLIVKVWLYPPPWHDAHRFDDTALAGEAKTIRAAMTSTAAISIRYVA